MPRAIAKPTLSRDALRKVKPKDDIAAELIQLRLAYSYDQKLLTGYVNPLIGLDHIYPRHWPAQASGRWSTIDPPETNWPRACINPECKERLLLELSDITWLSVNQIEHEWTEQCWSLRDILSCNEDEILITWDHDNIEGKIHDLIVNDEPAIQAHLEGYDLHTVTCCNIFSMDMPQNLKNPHTSTEDVLWRAKYNWQGKDTKQRVLAKNFNHGSKYSKTYRFVHRIQGIEQYGVTKGYLESLAKKYIASKGVAWQRKLSIMNHIQRTREARSLYGFKRTFYDSSEETAREGFSHMVSATVSDYNNETIGFIEDWLGDSVRLIHNAHDGDKLAVKRAFWYDKYASQDEIMTTLKGIIERPIEYQGKALTMTAGVRVYA